jgi:hypothetical protein
MFLAIAALLIQPGISPQLALSVERPALIQPVDAATETSTASEKDSLPAAPEPLVASAEKPADPAPIGLVLPIKKGTISTSDLRAETRRKEHFWLGLGLAAHSSAAFDAYSTRRAISSGSATELNPMLKPFAGNASMYAAIQVGPTVMDFLAKKMMYNEHTWVRRLWWVPQSASAVTSLFCGAHNIGVYNAGH